MPLLESGRSTWLSSLSHPYSAGARGRHKEHTYVSRGLHLSELLRFTTQTAALLPN